MIRSRAMSLVGDIDIYRAAKLLEQGIEAAVQIVLVATPEGPTN